MGDEDDRSLGLRPETEQFFLQGLACDLIERRERLVHQQDFWPEGERAADRDALLHAAGQFMWISVLEPLETGDLQPAPRFLLALRLRHVTPRDLHRQNDILQRG